jgi:hypothetical protein
VVTLIPESDDDLINELDEIKIDDEKEEEEADGEMDCI